MENRKISERIKELRKELKLTKYEFSSRIGMSINALYEWEHNKVEIKDSSLLLIEFVFNVSPDWLRQGKGNIFLPTLNPELEQVVAWMKSLSDKEAIWLRVDIEQKYDAFRKWQTDNQQFNS